MSSSTLHITHTLICLLNPATDFALCLYAPVPTNNLLDITISQVKIFRKRKSNCLYLQFLSQSPPLSIIWLPAGQMSVLVTYFCVTSYTKNVVTWLAIYYAYEVCGLRIRTREAIDHLPLPHYIWASLRPKFGGYNTWRLTPRFGLMLKGLKQSGTGVTGSPWTFMSICPYIISIGWWP